MKCVSTTFIAIIYNNIKTSYFKPTQGQRQGDPLSPLLFVICMEGLSAIIKKSNDERWWTPYSLRRFWNPPSHLTFANDFILFKKATTKGI